MLVITLAALIVITHDALLALDINQSVFHFVLTRRYRHGYIPNNTLNSASTIDLLKGMNQPGFHGAIIPYIMGRAKPYSAPTSGFTIFPAFFRNASTSTPSSRLRVRSITSFRSPSVFNGLPWPVSASGVK